MNTLKIALIFLLLPLAVNSTSVEKYTLSTRVLGANSIYICRIHGMSQDSLTFSVINAIKGKAVYCKKIRLFSKADYRDTSQYYLIGEYGKDTLQIITYAPVKNKTLGLYVLMVKDMLRIDSDQNAKRRRKRYFQFLFKLVDSDFLKDEALYELSRPSYHYVTEVERKRIFEIFKQIDNPSFYEWNICVFFIGYYNDELKKHLYKLIRRDLLEFEKNKYFIAQTGSMFSFLKILETDSRILIIIDDFFNDLVNVYVKYETANYLRRILEVK